MIFESHLLTEHNGVCILYLYQFMAEKHQRWQSTYLLEITLFLSLILSHFPQAFSPV